MSEIKVQREETHLHALPSANLADHPMPNSHEEIWRFTPLARIAPLVADYDGPAPEGAVTYDIRVPDGVRSGLVGPQEGIRGEVLLPVDRPSALSFTYTTDAMQVQIPAGVKPDRPIFVNVHGHDASRREYAHLVIDAGAGSEAIVVIRHDGSARFLGNVEIKVGDGANLTVASIQDWERDSLHGGLHVAAVGRDATYRHIVATFGGDLVRLQNNLYYTGPGGKVELYGIYFTDAGQHHEHRLFVDQNQPETTSQVDYRGALQGEGAHSVWNGDVLIRTGADNIDSYESNKNLILSDGARADSVPNLEIETGNIKGAGHASSTGRFDDEQLFYLMSRGLDEDTARRLVVQGFFFDIIRRIGIPEVEAQLRAEVDAELNQAIHTDGITFEEN